ncbi:MAG: tyrosine-type recombinase/integrase [Terriglobales bacterium]
MVTIYVRHSPKCKYADDEFSKRCNCRKHLRWSKDGKQFRQKAGTRSWAEAEEQKRRLEDGLAGRAPSNPETKSLADAVKVFEADKKNQGLTPDVPRKYTRELARLRAFGEKHGVFTVPGLTRDFLIAYQGDWLTLYPSSNTRSSVQARLKNFLRFCYDSKYLDRVPRLSSIKVDAPPTLPLTETEYAHLLATIPETFSGHHAFAPDKPRKVRAFVQLMRWTGLAISDAASLERSEIHFDKGKKLHRVVTSRQKTGTHVSVPLPPAIAKEVLTVLNGNPRYVFWTGNGLVSSTVTHWQDDMRKLFKAAGITSAGNMLSHRLRDTFAVDLLEKGVPLEEVSKLLGHESIKTTERHYAKWVKGRQDRLDSLVTASWVNKS